MKQTNQPTFINRVLLRDCWCMCHFTKMTVKKTVIVCVGNAHCRQSFLNKAFRQSELNQLQGVVETVFSHFVASLIC